MKEKGLVEKAFEVIWETVGLPSHGTVFLNKRGYGIYYLTDTNI